MTEIQVDELTFYVRTMYPKYYSDIRQGEIGAMLKFWGKAFEGYEYDEVEDVLVDYIKFDSEGVPPTPGQLIRRILDKLI